MTSVNEEDNESSNQTPFKDAEKLAPDDRLKNPRSCNERSDSGFSECSNCSTPSASCMCNLPLSEKKSSILEEQSSISSNDPEESTDSARPRTDEKTAVDDSSALSSEHDIRSEISSLEYDDVNKSTCDESQNIVVSLKVPTRRELYQNEQGDLLNEVERRKLSLEKTARKASSFKHEIPTDKMRRSKVALLMEKFETSRSIPTSTSKTKFASTNGTDLSKVLTICQSNNPASITAFDCVKSFEVEKKCGGEGFNDFSSDFHFVAKPKPATRNTTNPTTFRLSSRVREVTERLSRPKQYVEESTKGSILKQDTGTFFRSREFWKR